MRFVSPLRYPGGKAGLAPFIGDLLELNDLTGCAYYEPYAGGAGAALELLFTGMVSSIHINDADPRIYCLWSSVLEENDRFADKIQSVPLNIDEWHRQHKICMDACHDDRFVLGFAAFYMNRCNRSGVLKGAGPIGGYEQDGVWRLDVRFNRDDLESRVRAIGAASDCIKVAGLDAIDFLRQNLPATRGRARAFVYADPPYVIKGERLYLNAYREKDHAELARYLSRQAILPWLVSYDDAVLIQQLYQEHQLDKLPIRYSLQNKRAANELLIAPQWLGLPSGNKSVRIAA